uniref:MBL fold metallo-hydrolase n=1 Tax=Thioclava electrotropha TaxID=1549850 RepID=UPI0023A8BCFD
MIKPDVKAFFDTATFTVSYVVKDPGSKSCAVVDSVLDFDYSSGRTDTKSADEVIAYVQENGLEVEWILESHVHADHLSAAPYIQERVGGKIGIGDRIQVVQDTFGKIFNEGTAFQRDGSQFDRLFGDGDSYQIGTMTAHVMHTPGHTPEHVSFLVTDRGGGADRPMGVVTGDFVFVGALGRPDLLESELGVAGAREASARQLHASAREFIKFPEYLQVWPAHGSGSSCGKALGAVTQSTVGYECRANPQLAHVDDQDAFIQEILAGQPAPPLYFARM